MNHAIFRPLLLKVSKAQRYFGSIAAQLHSES
jgi:hypothetical protein